VQRRRSSPLGKILPGFLPAQSRRSDERLSADCLTLRELRQLLRASDRFSLVDITPIASEAQASNQRLTARQCRKYWAFGVFAWARQRSLRRAARRAAQPLPQGTSGRGLPTIGAGPAPAVAPRAALGAFSGQVLLGFAADVWTRAFGTDETVSSFFAETGGPGGVTTGAPAQGIVSKKR
jgi:hypothetical protein